MNETIARINEDRAKHGLKPLTPISAPVPRYGIPAEGAYAWGDDEKTELLTGDPAKVFERRRRLHGEAAQP